MLRQSAPAATDRGESLGAGTDIIVFIFRVALIVVLAIWPSFGQMGRHTPPAMRIALFVALTYTLYVAIGWYITSRQSLAIRPLLLQRPLAIIVDLVFITVVLVSVFPNMEASRVEFLREYYVTFYQLYYIVIIVAAVWYQLPGAILTALASIVLWSYVWAVMNPPAIWPPTPSLDLIWSSGALFMLLIALAAGLLATAMTRESHRAAQMHQELLLARRLQDAMLPVVLPVVPGFDVGIAFQPARLIGGDLYDLMELGQDQFLVCVGDMAGKSVYGLVHLSLVHSYVRAAARQGMRPAQIATHVNRYAYDTLQPDSYASLLVGILDAPAGIFTFANCGHLPPLFLPRADEEGATELSGGGTVIGGVPDPQYTESQAVMEPGDAVLIYTDGVSEARNRRRQLFGWKGIKEVATTAGPQAQEVAEQVLVASQSFSAQAGVDDATILVFRRTGVQDTGTHAGPNR